MDALYTVRQIQAPSPSAPVASPDATGSYLPNAGDLYYNGGNFADAFLRWDNPKWERDVDYMDCARVITDCATYEHDLELNRNWFQLVAAIPYARDFCTTWSDLPDYYDDCPTADVPDWGNDSLILSFGTYKAPDIEPGRDYYGFGASIIREVLTLRRK